MSKNTVVPKLIGGLGNQLFILASTIDVANRWGATVVFHDSPGNSHCSSDLSLSKLFPSIPVVKNIKIEGEVSGCESSYRDMLALIPMEIFVSGYNQSPKYIPDNFCEFLKNIPDVELGDMSNIAFLHVRRGDYVNHPIYQLNYKIYYRTAVHDLVKKNPDVKILVLSDDIVWSNENIPELLGGVVTRDKLILQTTEYPATSTLKLMTRCQAGAICANSTFSWWGAFPNKNRPIYMPYPWCSYTTDPNLDLYFEGVIKITSETGDIL